MRSCHIFRATAVVHFVPDVPNDLLFNNTATDVLRSSFLNGIQGDMAYKVTNVHTIRVGFLASGEQTQVKNLTTVEPLDPAGEAIDNPTDIRDGVNKFGWLFGYYIQDEWKLTSKLTLNTGVRFDQMVQFVDKNQVSPRFNLVYNPFWGTVFHTGYARNFTPPPQVLGQVYQAQYFNNTTNASAVGNFGPILPERSTVVDAGITQQLLPPCPSGTGGLFSKTPVAGDQLSGVGGWRRRLLQARDRSSGRRSVRTGLRSHRIQLRQGRELGHRGKS